jgi:threonine/homoserine/homoserine lactone efflux protein
MDAQGMMAGVEYLAGCVVGIILFLLLIIVGLSAYIVLR